MGGGRLREMVAHGGSTVVVLFNRVSNFSHRFLLALLPCLINSVT